MKQEVFIDSVIISVGDGKVIGKLYKCFVSQAENSLDYILAKKFIEDNNIYVIHKNKIVNLSSSFIVIKDEASMVLLNEFEGYDDLINGDYTIFDTVKEYINVETISETDSAMEMVLQNEEKICGLIEQLLTSEQERIEEQLKQQESQELTAKDHNINYIKEQINQMGDNLLEQLKFNLDEKISIISEAKAQEAKEEQHRAAEELKLNREALILEKINAGSEKSEVKNQSSSRDKVIIDMSETLQNRKKEEEMMKELERSEAEGKVSKASKTAKLDELFKRQEEKLKLLSQMRSKVK